MMTLHPVLDSSRRRLLAAALTRVLPPSKLTMARELLSAEKRGVEPQPEEILHWMRLNMPVAADRVEGILHPAD